MDLRPELPVIQLAYLGYRTQRRQLNLVCRERTAHRNAFTRNVSHELKALSDYTPVLPVNLGTLLGVVQR